MHPAKLPGLNENDLRPYFERADILRDCALQLQKDCAMYGLELHLPERAETTYHTLYQQLLPWVTDQIERRGEKIAALLYRIDVSESLVRQAAAENESWPASVTRLMLWRELQKVVIRHIYH
jgi:hypothetical protein